MKELVAAGQRDDDGIINRVPRSSTDMSTLLTSLRRRGRNWTRKPSGWRKRDFVVDARRHIAKCAGGTFLRDGLEVEHVDRVLGLAMRSCD
jgi:hypothetical protein